MTISTETDLEFAEASTLEDTFRLLKKKYVDREKEAKKLIQVFLPSSNKNNNNNNKLQTNL